MSRPRARLLSLPREHGAWITLGGSLLVGTVLSRRDPGPAPALGIALCLIVAFLVRSPLEQLAVGRPARGDLAAVAVFAALALAGAVLAGSAGLPWACAGIAIAICGGAIPAAARRARIHRHQAFEACAMAGLGAAALPIAAASGTPLAVAFFPSVALAVHAAISVPLLRTELRPRERVHAAGADLLGLATLAACAVLFALLGHPLVAAALVPRLLHLGARRFGIGTLSGPVAIGVREIALLACTCAVALATAARA